MQAVTAPFRAYPAAPLRDEIDGVHLDQCEAFLSCLKLATSYFEEQHTNVSERARTTWSSTTLACARMRSPPRHASSCSRWSPRRAVGDVQVHDADASSEPGCARDQQQPCPNDDGPDGSRDARTDQCETFDG